MTIRTKNIIVAIMALIIIGVILFVGDTDAAKYYVSNSGSNSNNGLSTGAPWLTLGHACSTLVANDTLLIMGGTWREYNPAPSDPNRHGTLVPIASGTSGHPIVYKAHSAYPRPIITSYGSDYAGYGILLAAGSIHDIVFDSLIQKKTSRGIVSWWSPSYITIKNCVIDSTGNVNTDDNSGGIVTLETGGWADSWIVQSCTLFHNWEHSTGTPTQNGSAFQLYHAIHWVIENNVIFDQPVSRGAIFLKGTDTTNVIRNNTIYNSGTGITLWYTSDTRVYGNIIYDCGNGITLEASPANSYPNEINRRIKIYNNTIYNYSDYAIGWRAWNSADGPSTLQDSTEIFNNLCIQRGYGLYKGSSTLQNIQRVYSDYNDFWRSLSSVAIQWHTGTFTLPQFVVYEDTNSVVEFINIDDNSVSVYPGFVDTTYAGGRDFHLTAGSPSAVKTGGRGGAYPTYMGAFDPQAAPDTIISKALLLHLK